MANQDIPVSGLQNTNSISTEDLALVTVVDELSATGYTSKHITEGNRARQYLGSFTWQDLETEAKDIFGAINEAATTGGNNVFYIHWTSPSTITESGADIAAAYADGSDLVILYTDSQTGQVYTLPLVKVDDNAGALNLSFGATIYQKAQMVAYLQLLKPSYTIQGKDCTTIRVPVIKDTTTTSTTETWSAKKINDTIAAKTEINDTTTSTTTTWSSDKIADELADKAEIADTVVSTASAWSSSRIVGLLPTDTASGAIASFDDGADGVPIVDGVFEVVASQAGTGDPSSTNPRVISGATGMSIYRAGANLWDEQWEVGGLNANGDKTANYNTSIVSKNLIPVKPNQTYYLVGSADRKKYYYSYWDNTKTRTGSRVQLDTSRTITTPANCYYLLFMQFQEGDTYNNDISINYPATDTTYHAYTGAVYNIDWTDEAGTVYGGTLNATTGVLTVTYATVDMGDLSYTYDATYTRMTTTPTDLKTGVTILTMLLKCEKFLPITDGRDIANVPENAVYNGIANDVPNVNFKTSYTDPAQFKTDFTGTKLCYPIENPVQIQLESFILPTLLGSNNIYCDTGDSSVTYHADVQKYIDKKIAAALSNRGLNLSKSAEPEEKEPEEVKEEVKEEQEGANNER